MRDTISIQRAANLHPAIRQEVQDGITHVETYLLPDTKCIRIVQGIRTIEYQNGLFNQAHDGIDNDGDGRIDEPDEHVTNAKGGQSYHNYGLAFDFCILFKNDKGVFIYKEKESWIVDEDFKKVIAYFKSLGYVAGIDWPKPKTDSPHLQKNFGNHWSVLLDRYNKGLFIPGTKYVTL